MEKRSAYFVTGVGSDCRLAIAREGDEGYYPVRDETDAGGPWDSYEQAKAAADRYNERLGLSGVDVVKIVVSTMPKREPRKSKSEYRKHR